MAKTIKTRPAHWLRRTTRKTTPTDFIFFDTETTSDTTDPAREELSLRLGWAAYVRFRPDEGDTDTDWLYFTDPATFWDFVERHARTTRRLYVVAHNVVFDLAIVRWESALLARGWALDRPYTQQSTQIIEMSHGRRRMTLFSSTNLFPGKLAGWGNALHLPKLPVDFDVAEVGYLSAYCRRDVEILIALFEQWLAFLRDEDLGAFKLTIASQAFESFRHRFMPRMIHIHDVAGAMALEREAYFGGRVQPFQVCKLPDQDYYYLDVNSMYPYVMRDNDFPVELAHYIEEPTVESLKFQLRNHLVVANVDVALGVPAIPTHLRGRNVYPVGRFNTTLTTPELKYVLAHGTIEHVYRAASYYHRQIFSSYVDFWFSRKLAAGRAGDTLRRKQAKLFLNSLYGKFGQKGRQTRDIGPYNGEPVRAMKTYNVDTHTFGWMFTAFGRWFEEVETGEGYNSLTAIAAHTTAYARQYLWQAITRAGRNHVYYVDTDSMIVDAVGMLNMSPLIDSERLGAWKIEDKARDVRIYGPKDYEFGGLSRLKGIRNDDELLKSDVFAISVWPGFRTLAREDTLDSYTIRHTTRRLAHTVDFGRLGADRRVRPYLLPQHGREVTQHVPCHRDLDPLLTQDS